MQERDGFKSGLRSAEEVDDAHGDTHAQLVSLDVGHPRLGHLVGEREPALGARAGGQLQRGGVDIEEAANRLHAAQHGRSVARDHCDGPEDLQALPIRQAEPEVRAGQLLGGGLEHAGQGREGDERVLLAFGTGADIEARQEYRGVTAEFAHKSIAILERRQRLGGTWDLFRYPGIRSDSDMLTFGYKWRPWRELKVL